VYSRVSGSWPELLASPCPDRVRHADPPSPPHKPFPSGDFRPNNVWIRGGAAIHFWKPLPDLAERGGIPREKFVTVPDDTVLVPAEYPTLVPGAGTRRFAATRDSAGSYAMVRVPVGRTFSVRMPRSPDRR